MSKKDYVSAAAIVDNIRTGNWTNEPPNWANPGLVSSGIEATPEYDRAVQTAEAFIVLFSAMPRFDRQRFLVACGLAEKGGKS